MPVIVPLTRAPSAMSGPALFVVASATGSASASAFTATGLSRTCPVSRSTPPTVAMTRLPTLTCTLPSSSDRLTSSNMPSCLPPRLA